MNKLLCHFGAMSLALLSISSFAKADTVLDTTTGPYTTIQPFGKPNTSTYGQTFTVGSDNVLNSFSLFLASDSASPIDFNGYIYEWNSGSSSATGTALFASSLRTLNATDVTMTEFVFSVPSLSLETGKTYVAFLNAIDNGYSSYSHMNWANDVIQGGFVFLNNGNDFSSITTDSWAVFGTSDVWFKASFSSQVATPVPEPSTYGLMGAAAMVGFAALRRRKASK